MANTHEEMAACCTRLQPTRPWGPDGGRALREQVRFSDRGGGYAYRPNQFHCLDPESTIAALNYLHEAGVPFDELRELEVELPLPRGFSPDELPDNETVTRVSAHPGPHPVEYLVTVQDDVEDAVESHIDEMRDRHIDVEPNYVLFADGAGAGCGGGCGCGFGGPTYGSPVFGSPVFGSPVFGSPVFGSPVFGSPVYGSGNAGGGQFAMSAYASPVYGSPVFGSPVFGSPVFGSNYKAEGRRSNTARPAAAPQPPHPIGMPQAAQQTIVVLDTGIARHQWRPPLLDNRIEDACEPEVFDPPDHDGDDFYDPASGHGTFIAGIVEQLAPGQALVIRRVLSSFGDGDIGRDIVPVIDCIREAILNGDDQIGSSVVVNMSFSGYADREMCSLARAIRRLRKTGAVVVASVGNDATCRPTFPACLPGVVGVGALDLAGPAAFTNHGPWVRACAPGTDLVSSFYTRRQNAPPLPGDLPVPGLPGTGDPAQFEGWARWSGTSFAAPVVAAALVRYMAVASATGNNAVDALIDAASLYRIPGLGTVVNACPPV